MCHTAQLSSLRKGSLTPSTGKTPSPLYPGRELRAAIALHLDPEGKAENSHSSTLFTSRVGSTSSWFKTPPTTLHCHRPRQAPSQPLSLSPTPGKSPSASAFPQKHLASTCGPSLLPLKSLPGEPGTPDNAEGSPRLPSPQGLCPPPLPGTSPLPSPASAQVGIEVTSACLWTCVRCHFLQEGFPVSSDSNLPY